MTLMLSRILFIHGAGGGGWQWRDWRNVFWAAGYLNTEAPNLHPKSTGLETTVIEDYAAQVIDWCASKPEAANVMIGASMGGILALLAAGKCLPQAIVLVNSVPPAGVPGWPPTPRTFPDRVAWSSEIKPRDTQESMPEADPMTAAWAHNRWRDESGRVLRALWSGIPVQQPQCPILSICSGEDRTIPADVCIGVANYLGAEQRVFPHISHVGALLGSDACRIAQYVVHWLRALRLS